MRRSYLLGALALSLATGLLMAPEVAAQTERLTVFEKFSRDL